MSCSDPTSTCCDAGPESPAVEIQTISITGRRWFGKTHGNTYFSCEASINGVEVASIDYEYGYGDQYLQRIVEVMQGMELLPENTGRKALTWYLRDLCVPGGFTCHVSDVDRKRDL